MAGKDEKDLHAHQLPDSELDRAVGGTEFPELEYRRATCNTCGESTGWCQWPGKHASYNNWKQNHLYKCPGTTYNEETAMGGPFGTGLPE